MDKNKANKKMNAIYKWAIEEENKIEKKLKDEGRYVSGLDTMGNCPEFIKLKSERNRKLRELQNQYFKEMALSKDKIDK